METSADTKKSNQKSIAYQQTVILKSDADMNLPAISNQSPDEMDFNSPIVSEFEKMYYLHHVIGKYESDKYLFLEKIFSGGMGAIFKVQDQELRRPVAMKVIKPSLKNDEDIIRHFVTEARITGLLEHPNIIPVHEIGLHPKTGLYFTMKLARGEPLIHILDAIKQKKTDYVEKYHMFHLLQIFRKVCDALSFAHSFNIIHRDIKPHNIMVGEYGEVLLMDWGLAQFIGDQKGGAQKLSDDMINDLMDYSIGTETTIKGTPTYMAPEQVKGDPVYLDERTDIFLLGATLYHICTLEPPYQGDNIYEILYKAENRDLIPPEKRNPYIKVPREISNIIMKSMAFNKDDRYQTVRELSEDIDDLMAGKWKHQEKKYFNEGELLMLEGERGNEAYLILKGKVEVFKVKDGRKLVLGILKEGDIVGEMALISQEKRSASVVAIEETEVAVLTKQLLSQNLKKIPPYIEKIVSTITQRLQEANERIHPYTSTDCTYIVLRQLILIFKSLSGGKSKGKFSFEKLSRQISEDIGIPVHLVKDALMKAVNLNLISRKGDWLAIHDIDELADFITLAKTFTGGNRSKK